MADNGVLDAQPAPVTVRRFGDIPATRKNVYDSVLSTVQNMKPQQGFMQNSLHSLHFNNVHYADPETQPLDKQKEAVLKGQTLSRRLRGTVSLVDNATGDTLDSKDMTLAAVPVMSNRGTYILRGNEWTLGNQLRLRPGVYTRVKDNGDIESHVNVAGKGFGHRYILDPETGVFRLNIGQSYLPLLPILRAMGANNKELSEAWGSELLSKNLPHDSPHVINKIYQRLIRFGDETLPAEAKSQAVAEKMSGMLLDPEVTEMTLGKRFPTLSKEAVLAATKKVLGVYRGEAEPDDRDHLAFQSVFGPEDLFSERLMRNRKPIANALMKATFRRNLSGLQPGFLTESLIGAIQKSGLGLQAEEINTSELLDQATRITRMGEGGISSLDSVHDESRNVHPSQLNYIDILRSPESLKAGVDSRIAYGALKGSDRKFYSPYRNLKTGEEEYLTPKDTAEKTIAFPNELNKGSQVVAAMVKGKARYVPAKDVEYEMPDMEKTFSPLSNLVPMKSAIKGQRVVMGSRQMTQALPLRNPEAPLVQGATPEDPNMSFEEKHGEFMGAVKAPKGGRVVSVSPTGMKVKYDDGTSETHELYDNFPYSRKSVSGSTKVWIKRPDSNEKYLYVKLSEYKFKPGDYVLSVGKDSKRSCWSKITGYVRHRNDKKLYKVRTTSGRSVVVTEDHSLLTMGDGGDLVPIYPHQCVDRDVYLPVASPQADGPREDKLNALAVIDGLYLSRGHVVDKEKGVISFAIFDRADRYEEVAGLFRTAGIENFEIVGRKEIVITDLRLAGRLLSRYGDALPSRRIPSSVMAKSYAVRRGLVVGYVSGLGSVNRYPYVTNSVDSHAASSDVRDSVVSLLMSLGDFCNVSDSKTLRLGHMAGYSNDVAAGGSFKITKKYATKRNRWFIYKDREKALVKDPEKAGRTFEPVPVLTDGGWRLADKNDPGSFPRGFWLWQISDVVWDKVVSVRAAPHEEFVYDLSVAGSEAFATNLGIVVHNTYVHNTPLVGAGDRFGPGQVLAKSNYTDDNGVMALGLNPRVAYMSYHGKNHDDAFVVSESFAKRLESEHLYQHAMDLEEGTKVDKRGYVGIFPGRYDKKTMAGFDDNGLIKAGTEVHYGDPLVLAVRKKEFSASQVHKKRGQTFTDATLTWEHHAPGVVTDAVRTQTGVNVAVKSYTPAQVGDKLAARVGSKGVIAEVVPDEKMPYDEQGRPAELIVSPLGLISRQNSEQILDTVLGKIAERTGKPYKIQDFKDIDDLTEFAIGELKKHNVKDTETFTDPVTGRKIPDILTGKQFFMKLSHTAESKDVGRGLANYTADEIPAKGGDEGCFLGHQEVETPFGPVSISTIVNNELEVLVKTYSEREKCWLYRLVTDWFRKTCKAGEIRVITVSSQRKRHVIYATIDHEFFLISGRRRRAATLKAGDLLVTWDRKAPPSEQTKKVPAKVLSIKPYATGVEGSQDVDVYDITVAMDHRYSAGGVLVSNSKRMALMDSYALLSSGSTAVLRDAHVIRGQQNDPYWSAFQAGFRPPEPKVPLIYQKFVNYLRGSGINVVRNGPQMHIMALTNKDVRQLAGNRTIKNAETVSWKEGEKPVKGGLFDPTLFGGTYGHDGTNWAAIELAEPMPNPVMEKPIRKLLGLREADFEEILAGKRQLDGATGSTAIRKALSKIDVTKSIANARAEIAGSKKTARNDAIIKLGYLKSLEKTGMKPEEWVLDKIPVLPPIFRPIPAMQHGAALEVGDANFLYKEAFDANENLKNMGKVAEDVGDERLTLYNSFKAVVGLGDPVQPKNKERGVNGLLRKIFGAGPKHSMIQAKLMGANTDIVGRAAISPDPDLDMDQVGLPEERAWTVYRPFVIRRLVRGGVGKIEAAQAVKNMSELARRALVDEMAERPVIVDRAPVLHRYGVMAFWPVLTKGATLRVNPVVTKGFAADFDGDAMQYHVPASDDAKEEAIIKMLPSRNLLNVQKFGVHYVPQQEYLGGLYTSTARKKEGMRPRVFRNAKDAIAAYKRGEIEVDHPVEIVEH